VNIRRTTLLIASILAVGTGWLTLTYLSSLRPPSMGEQRPVLIAAQEITARERITPAMFVKETRPAQALEPGALSDPNQATGSLALITIPVGSQLTSSEIGTNVASALPVRLQPGMRAVSIPVDRVKDVAGLIQPGDRVDVIAVPARVGNETPQGRTILRGATVLASGTQMESTPTQANANNGQTAQTDAQNLTTVTLGVTPAQADLLATADVNATLRLALRSPRDPVGREPAERFVLPAPAAAPPAAAVQPAPSAVAAPAPPASTPRVQPMPPAPAARANAAAPRGVEVIEESPSGSTTGS
jgi:pilus assembly protein CpaB